MPMSVEQLSEKLSKTNIKVSDSIKEMEVLMNKERGGLLDKNLLIQFRKNIFTMNIENSQSAAETCIEILEECISVCKAEKKRREVQNELIRIQKKGKLNGNRN